MHESWGTSQRRVARSAGLGNPLSWGEFSVSVKSTDDRSSGKWPEISKIINTRTSRLKKKKIAKNNYHIEVEGVSSRGRMLSRPIQNLEVSLLQALNKMDKFNKPLYPLSSIIFLTISLTSVMKHGKLSL